MIEQRFLCRLVLRILVVIGLVGGAAVSLGQTVTQGNGGREISVNSSLFDRGAALPGWYKMDGSLPPARSDSPLVMRLSDSHFRGGDESRVVVHRAIQVNDGAMVAEVGQYPLTFNPEYQRIEIHLLKIHRGESLQDRMASSSVRFFHPEKEVEQAIYTGSITAVLITEDVRPGDTFEIAYSIIGQNPVFGGKFVDTASWDGLAPTLHRRITLDMPRARKVNHRLVGARGEVPKPSEAIEGERRIVRYEAWDIPAVQPESLVPQDVPPVAWVQFSEFRDWDEVNQWAQQLFAMDHGRSIAVPEGLAGKTPSESIMRALHFVQENIRYLAIAIGENSHRPYPPGEVLARRYGDCKDKSTLLVALLSRLGVVAEPVLVSTQMRKGLIGLLPSPAVFDHAIVRVTAGGRAFYLDPTLLGQGDRLDTLGTVHEGNEVLVVSPGTKSLSAIPVPDRNAVVPSTRSERITLAQIDQPAEMEVEYGYPGKEAEAARRAIGRMSPLQVKRAYEGLLDRRYPKAELLGEPVIRDDRQENFMTVLTRYRIPAFLEKQGDRWAMRYEAGNLGAALPLPDSAKRTLPMAMSGYPWRGGYSLDLRLPEEFDARYTPEHRSLKAEAFDLDENLNFSGRNLRLNVSLELTADRVAPANAAKYLEDMRGANGYFRGTLFIRESDRRSRQVFLPIKQLSRQQLEQVMANTEKALSSSKLSGRETYGIRCERALAAAHLERFDVALAESENAVDEQPNSRDTLRCRGFVRLASGDLAGSTKDLSRAIALGASDAEIYFLRGLANYYSKQWKQAAEDFVAYGRLTIEPRAKAQAEIWLDAVRRQTREPLMPGPLELSAWPAPVLKALRGQSSMDDVISDLNRTESGSKLEERLAEAYFYFHQYLATSNPPRSMAYLKRAIDLAPLYSFVQIAARNEMPRGSSLAH